MPRANKIVQTRKPGNTWRKFTSLITKKKKIRPTKMPRVRTRSMAQAEEREYDVDELYNEDNIRLDDSPASTVEGSASTVRRRDYNISIIGSQLLLGAISTSQMELNAQSNIYGASRSPTPGFGYIEGEWQGRQVLSAPTSARTSPNHTTSSSIIGQLGTPSQHRADMTSPGDMVQAPIGLEQDDYSTLLPSSAGRTPGYFGTPDFTFDMQDDSYAPRASQSVQGIKPVMTRAGNEMKVIENDENSMDIPNANAATSSRANSRNLSLCMSRQESPINSSQEKGGRSKWQEYLEELQDIEEKITKLEDNMFKNKKWWTRYTESTGPLKEQLERLIDNINNIEPIGSLMTAACNMEDRYESMVDRFSETAKNYITAHWPEGLGDSNVSDEYGEHIQGDKEGASDNNSKTPDNQGASNDEQGSPEGNKRSSFSIWQDGNLEVNLASTRCIKQFKYGQTDLSSRVNRVLEENKLLNERVTKLEENHKCDPTLYERLSTIEKDIRRIYSTMATKNSLHRLNEEVGHWVSDTRKIDEKSKNAFETCQKFKEKLSNVEAVTRRLHKNLTNENRRKDSEFSKTNESIIELDEFGLPIHPDRAGKSNSVANKGQDTIDQRKATDTMRMRASPSGTSRPGSGVDTHKQHGRNSGEQNSEPMTEKRGPLITHPNDRSVDLNKRQRIPDAWVRKTPYYYPENTHGPLDRSRTDPRHIRSPCQDMQRASARSSETLDKSMTVGKTRAERYKKELQAASRHLSKAISENPVSEEDSNQKIKDMNDRILPWKKDLLSQLVKKLESYKEHVDPDLWEEGLLTETDAVLEGAQEWERSIQTKYSQRKCSTKPLSGKHMAEIPIFDGKGEMSIQEFLARFKAMCNNEGTEEDRADLLHKKYLSTQLQNLTEAVKDDWNELTKTLVKKFGQPQTVISNIVRTVSDQNLPSGESLTKLAVHMHRLQSIMSQINTLTKYGMSLTVMKTHMTSYQFISEIRNRIPEHLIVDLNEQLHGKNIPPDDPTGEDYLKVLKEFIKRKAMSLDTFYSQPSSESKGKSKDISKRKSNSPVKSSVNVTTAALNKQFPVSTGRDHQEETKWRIPNWITSDGRVKCQLSGRDHRQHVLVECERFWSKDVDYRRDVLRDRACWSCFGPRNKCYGGCKSSPPEAMICQICKRDSRFAPAIAMCPIEVHKDGIVDSDVVATMKDFLKTFDCGSLDAAIVVGRAPSK